MKCVTTKTKETYVYLYEEVEAGHSGIETVRQQHGVGRDHLVQLSHVRYSLSPAVNLFVRSNIV